MHRVGMVCLVSGTAGVLNDEPPLTDSLQLQCRLQNTHMRLNTREDYLRPASGLQRRREGFRRGTREAGLLQTRSTFGDHLEYLSCRRAEALRILLRYQNRYAQKGGSLQQDWNVPNHSRSRCRKHGCFHSLLNVDNDQHRIAAPGVDDRIGIAGGRMLPS